MLGGLVVCVSVCARAWFDSVSLIGDSYSAY